MAKNFVMSQAILELLQENSWLSGKEVYGELKKRYPGEKINENSVRVMSSIARQKLGLRKSHVESVLAMDCDGHVHNIAGVAKKEHELYPIYRRCMKSRERCENRQNRAYAHYGGRGICFGFENPTAMLAYVIGLPGFTQAIKNGLTLDRIDNDGDYAPGNLRWASKKTQMANRRNTRFVDLENGRRVTRVQAVNVIHRVTGHSREALRSHFKRGKSFAEALEFAQRATGERVDEQE